MTPPGGKELELKAKKGVFLKIIEKEPPTCALKKSWLHEF